jgi:peptide/nickel transport system substrate-binding protein
VFLGKATSGAATCNRICFWYKDEWTNLHATYDMAKANELLDDMGLTNRDGDGFRTKPSGDRLEIVIEVNDAQYMWVPTSELTKSYWEAVGVRTVLKVEDSDLLWTRLGANEHHVFTWVMDGQGPAQLLSGNFSYGAMSWWGLLWDQWRSSVGETGEEPPQNVKEYIEWCEQVTQTPPDQITGLAHKAWDRSLEEVWMIGTCGYAGKPCVSSKKLGNVDKLAYGDNWDIGGTCNNWLEMYFWKEM